MKSDFHLHKLVRIVRWCLVLVFACLWVLLWVAGAQAAELSNDTLTFRLQVSPEGIPIIKEVVWRTTHQIVFRDMGTPEGLDNWVPPSLIPTTLTTPMAWKIQVGEDQTTATATRELAHQMSLTWILDLPKRGQLFRLRVRLTNRGQQAQSVDWFPAWSANWNTGDQSQWARWWQALQYDRIEQPLPFNRATLLGSRGHSSDDAGGGVNPYWVVGGKARRLYFSLQWSGGWSVLLKRVNRGFNFTAYLPPEETRLLLEPGETIDGPALLVMPTAAAGDTTDRALWMRDRQALGQQLYTSPPPAFPLSYNTWYAARQRVNAGFLKRQIAALSPYGFDAFVIDAGWFGEGRWEAHQTKFSVGELAAMLAALKAKGIKPGLWTTPQYVTDATNTKGLPLEQPPLVNNFLGGYLADLSSPKYADYLTDHVQRLRKQYSIDYWKYDQPLFFQPTSAGKMKKVIGFQQALEAVRRANPDLVIENCYNGGRMLNEFTLLATQTSWLLDHSHRQKLTPQMNLRSTLNALEFVFPWAALRFTVKVDELNQNDDEETRLHCRSAMMGSWGLSTDLSAISERQRAIIVKEIAHYRRLNPLKSACLYDLRLPEDLAAVAGVTFYDRTQQHAGIVLFRWQRKGAFTQRLTLPKLKPGVTYKVVDADTKVETPASGATLIRNGVSIAFSSQRQSALIFIEPITPRPVP
ncbi:MAG: alpha-galactosidase [Acidobacteria bacterium]|nr:alpha-galactosidase [Acidobacteriota bacterium]